jgi:polyhydroxybutyrate depolymerase
LNRYDGPADPAQNSNWVMGVEDAVENWAMNNGCGKEPIVKELTEDVSRLTYRGCTKDADVILYRIRKAGHTWPGSAAYAKREDRVTNMDIDASRLIWEFFEAHPLP